MGITRRRRYDLVGTASCDGVGDGVDDGVLERGEVPVGEVQLHHGIGAEPQHARGGEELGVAGRHVLGPWPVFGDTAAVGDDEHVDLGAGVDLAHDGGPAPKGLVVGMRGEHEAGAFRRACGDVARHGPKEISRQRGRRHTNTLPPGTLCAAEFYGHRRTTVTNYHAGLA